MKTITISITMLCTVFFAAPNFATQHTVAYLDALAHFLEHNVFGEDGLNVILEGCAVGRMLNPISELEKHATSQQMTAFDILQQYIDTNEIDANVVCAWASDKQGLQGKEKRARKLAEKETTLAWGEAAPPVMSLGNSLLCLINSNSLAECFGSFEYIGTKYFAKVPENLGPVVSISAGNEHACAINAAGTVRCWNVFTDKVRNYRGEPNDIGKVRSVSAGSSFTCAITDSGLVRCWGFDSRNQTRVPKDLGPAIAVAAGGEHACAIKADGFVDCWGSNSHGQRDVPKNLGQVRAIASGLQHNCAVKPDGVVQCWGDPEHGRTSVPHNLGLVDSVSAGYSATCAVKKDGFVVCWGQGADRYKIPEDFGPVRSVRVGLLAFCAVTVAGEARCWGDDWNLPRLNYPSPVRVWEPR